MPEELREFASGVASSKDPRLDLIPYGSLARLADRFELGIERKGDKAWNSSSTNTAPLTDEAFIIDRAMHAVKHAYRLIDKLRGKISDDGDDDAAAIMWAGAFLCEATAALEAKHKAERVKVGNDLDSLFPKLPDSILFLARDKKTLDRFNEITAKEMVDLVRNKGNNEESAKGGRGSKRRPSNKG